MPDKSEIFEQDVDTVYKMCLEGWDVPVAHVNPMIVNYIVSMNDSVVIVEDYKGERVLRHLDPEIPF